MIGSVNNQPVRVEDVVDGGLVPKAIWAGAASSSATRRVSAALAIFGPITNDLRGACNHSLKSGTTSRTSSNASC